MNIISPIRKSIISASVLAALPKKGLSGKWYRVDDSVYLWSDVDQDYFEVGVGGPGGSVAWADITGDPSDNADLVTELDSRASAANAYADSLVVGLWDDRGSFDASGGAYPSSGGSGTAGAIKKGDVWTISVAGTLPTGQVVEVGDLVRALVDSPGNTQTNWAITQNNIGFVPFNSANVDTDGTLAANSDSKVASQKAAKTYADTKIPSSYLDTDGTLAANSDVKVATQKAAKTYMDTALGSYVRRKTYSMNATSGTVIGSSTTTYMSIYAGSTAVNATESNRWCLISKAGTMRDLYLLTAGTQHASGSLVVTFRKEASDTAIVVTIAAGSAAGVFSNTANSVSVASGDRCAYKIQNNATSSAAAITNFEVQHDS